MGVVGGAHLLAGALAGLPTVWRPAERSPLFVLGRRRRGGRGPQCWEELWRSYRPEGGRQSICWPCPHAGAAGERQGILDLPFCVLSPPPPPPGLHLLGGQGSGGLREGKSSLWPAPCVCWGYHMLSAPQFSKIPAPREAGHPQELTAPAQALGRPMAVGTQTPQGMCSLSRALGEFTVGAGWAGSSCGLGVHPIHLIGEKLDRDVLREPPWG